MKILHIVGDSAFGGGSRIVGSLAACAREEGHAVAVLTTCAAFQRDLEDRGVDVVPLDFIWRPIRPLHDLQGLVRLTAFLRGQKYDLVHTHTSKAGFVGRRAARTAGVPIVVHTLHGFAYHDGSAQAAKTVFVALERMAAAWCDRIVAVSEYLRQEALTLGMVRPDKIVAIPNGIPSAAVATPAEREAARASLALPAGTFAMLSMGRLAPQKGLEDLLAAMPAVIAGASQPVRLLIVGEGPLEGRLRRLAAATSRPGSVSFLGFRTDVMRLLAAADLVLLPSLREGLSIALLEAIAAGRPVVATNIPSNVEGSRDGEAARLVPCRSPAALAAAVLDLMVDASAREALAMRARRVYEAHYTEARMLAGYMDLYRELASPKSSPAVGVSD